MNTHKSTHHRPPLLLAMNTSYTFFYSINENNQNTAPHTISIPIDTPSGGGAATPIPVSHPTAAAAAAVTRIQAVFRGHQTRALVHRIRAINAEVGRYERLIQRQDTVDAVRGDERERLRVGEGLMALLLQLDSVPGLYPPVRELRRRVSRRIVEVQEIFDAVVGAPSVGVMDGIPGSLEELVAAGCGEGRGAAAAAVGGSRERAFRCLEKFLWGDLI